MQTVVLVPKTDKARQRLMQHGTTWEVKVVKPTSILVESLGETFHAGAGLMEKDWRWIQLHGDKQFFIALGQSTLPQTPHQTTVLPSCCEGRRGMAVIR